MFDWLLQVIVHRLYDFADGFLRAVQLVCLGEPFFDRVPVNPDLFIFVMVQNLSLQIGGVFEGNETLDRAERALVFFEDARVFWKIELKALGLEDLVLLQSSQGRGHIYNRVPNVGHHARVVNRFVAWFADLRFRNRVGVLNLGTNFNGMCFLRDVIVGILKLVVQKPLLVNFSVDRLMVVSAVVGGVV